MLTGMDYISYFYPLRIKTLSIFVCIFILGAPSLWSGGAWRSHLVRSMLPKSSTLKSYLPEVGTTNIFKHIQQHKLKHSLSVTELWAVSIAHSEKGFRALNENKFVCVWLNSVSDWQTVTQKGRDSSTFWIVTFSMCVEKTVNTCQVICHAVIVLLHFLWCAVLPPFVAFIFVL